MVRQSLLARSSAPVQVQPVTRGPKHHFFGYYDKCPWDATGQYMLTMEVDFMDRMPEPDDPAVIGLIDLQNDNRFIPLAETYAWNWQQGAMLQWVPSEGERLIVYNHRDNDHFSSVVLNIDSGESRTLPLPVYALSHDGRKALSLNFARVHRTRRGYGYCGVSDPWEDDPCPECDGIYLMDMATGDFRLILSIAEVARYSSASVAASAEHWIEHLQFNPTDTRFSFFHRYQRQDTSTSVMYTHLFTADPDGSNVHRLNDRGMVSHFDWLDQDHILAWARRGKTVAAVQRNGMFNSGPARSILALYRRFKIPVWLRQSLYGDRFFLFTDRSETVEIIGAGTLTADGHCSYSPDRNWILTDTRPNRDNKQVLMLYNSRDRALVEIGRFYIPPELVATPFRCDLHPRWSRNGLQVCIDSIHEGHRQMYGLDVSDIVKGRGTT